MSEDRTEAYSVLEQAYFGENKHESAEIDRLSEILGGVPCFADVGASLGQYTYYSNKILKGAKFYCVEADPDKAARLRELTRDWESESGNTFEIVERAASDKEEELTFFIPEDHLSSGAFFPIPGATSDWKELKVQATTLDQIFEGVEVDFMKLDVEGAEYRALLGASKLLQRCNLRLLLEIAP
jgi:FkbM family methyltransferase